MPEQKSSTGNLPENILDLVRQLFIRLPHLSVAGEDMFICFRAIVDVFEHGGVLFICGNGGSFADAVHIKGELAKSFEKPRPLTNTNVINALKKYDMGRGLIDNLQVGLPVIVLGESHSLRSAWENDCDPEFVYAQELNTFAGCVKPAALLGISTSGNAKNVIAAMTLARAYGLTTIGFTCQDGGQLAELADIPWRTPGNSTAEVQENQVPLYHTLCRMIETHFFGNK